MIVVMSKQNPNISLFHMQRIRPHRLLTLNMNQNSEDLSNQYSGNVPIKEIKVPKDVGDMIEYRLNKAKEAEDVRNNITIVKPSSRTPGTKKIRITNLNPEKIRNIEVAIEEKMESSDSESDEDWDNFLDSIGHEV